MSSSSSPDSNAHQYPLVGIVAAATAMLHLKLSTRDLKKYVHFSLTAGFTPGKESIIISNVCKVTPQHLLRSGGETLAIFKNHVSASQFYNCAIQNVDFLDVKRAAKETIVEMVYDYYGTRDVSSHHDLHKLAVSCAEKQQADFAGMDAECDPSIAEIQPPTCSEFAGYTLKENIECEMTDISMSDETNSDVLANPVSQAASRLDDLSLSECLPNFNIAQIIYVDIQQDHDTKEALDLSIDGVVPDLSSVYRGAILALYPAQYDAWKYLHQDGVDCLAFATVRHAKVKEVALMSRKGVRVYRATSATERKEVGLKRSYEVAHAPNPSVDVSPSKISKTGLAVDHLRRKLRELPI